MEVYAYRLQDFLKAEEYCKRVYSSGDGPTSAVFLTLLRIYLLPGPTAPPAAELLPPALELISRHSPRLDPVATLQLLPPLVTARDVRAFLLEALRAPRFDTRVVRHVQKAREEQVARRLVVLQSKRVRITDSRMSVSWPLSTAAFSPTDGATTDALNVTNVSAAASSLFTPLSAFLYS